MFVHSLCGVHHSRSPAALTAASSTTTVSRAVGHPVARSVGATLTTTVTTIVVTRLRPGSLPVLVETASATSGSRWEDFAAVPVVSTAALFAQTVLSLPRVCAIVQFHNLILLNLHRLFNGLRNRSGGYAAVLVIHVQKSAVGLSKL